MQLTAVRHCLQALQTKIDLKNAALAALPADLREEASREDSTPPPLSRRMPMHTPPVQDYRRTQDAGIRTGRRIGTKHQ